MTRVASAARYWRDADAAIRESFSLTSHIARIFDHLFRSWLDLSCKTRNCNLDLTDRGTVAGRQSANIHIKKTEAAIIAFLGNHDTAIRFQGRRIKAAETASAAHHLSVPQTCMKSRDIFRTFLRTCDVLLLSFNVNASSSAFDFRPSTSPRIGVTAATTTSHGSLAPHTKLLCSACEDLCRGACRRYDRLIYTVISIPAKTVWEAAGAVLGPSPLDTTVEDEIGTRWRSADAYADGYCATSRSRCADPIFISPRLPYRLNKKDGVA